MECALTKEALERTEAEEGSLSTMRGRGGGRRDCLPLGEVERRADEWPASYCLSLFVVETRNGSVQVCDVEVSFVEGCSEGCCW